MVLSKPAMTKPLVWAALSLLEMVAGCRSSTEVAIADIDPKVGATQGDQYVKIQGGNFRRDTGYTVYFGAKKAPQVMFVDASTQLTKTPPGSSPGAVDVLIRVDDGHAFRLPSVFKFEQVGVGAAGTRHE